MNRDIINGQQEHGAPVTPGQLSRLLCTPPVPSCPSPLPSSSTPTAPASPPPSPRVPLPSPAEAARQEASFGTGGTAAPPMPAAARRLVKPSDRPDSPPNSPLPLFNAPSPIAYGLSPCMAAQAVRPSCAAAPHHTRMQAGRFLSAATPRIPAVSCCARCARDVGSKQPANYLTLGDKVSSGKHSSSGSQ